MSETRELKVIHEGQTFGVLLRRSMSLLTQQERWTVRVARYGAGHTLGMESFREKFDPVTHNEYETPEDAGKVALAMIFGIVAEEQSEQ